MSVPRQTIGLTICKCPTDANNIRSVTFTNSSSLQIVKGSLTESQLSLSSLFIPVDNASKTVFTLKGKTASNFPYTLTKLNLEGVDEDNEVKFLALFPQYSGTVSTTTPSTDFSACSSPNGVASNIQYIEWAFVDSIEEGELVLTDVTTPSSSSFFTGKVNRIEYGYGAYYSFTGSTGPVWLATDGGLLKWNGVDMTQRSTLNSDIQSDIINAIAVASDNAIWLASDNGISKFTEAQGFIKFYDITNSSLISNNCLDIKILDTNYIVTGTTGGLSIYDTVGLTWSNFTIYNTPSLLSNSINRVFPVGATLYIGSNSGVNVYNNDTVTWGATYSSTGITGWTGSSNKVTALEYYDTKLAIGTTGGLVLINVSTGYATTYTGVTGGSGPSSSYVSSLRVVSYQGTDDLYIGHTGGGFSVYGLTSGTWRMSLTASYSSGIIASTINDILVDSDSENSSYKTMLVSTDNGLASVLINSSFSVNGSRRVPESTKSTNMMLSYPYNDETLVSVDQNFYFTFSKSMGSTSNSPGFTNYFNLYTGTTAGATVSGSWTWSDNYKTAIFAPGATLTRSHGYVLSVTNGATATDNSYLKETKSMTFHSEDIVPILGWNPLGKIFVLSGAEEHLTQGIYLRNPQDFDIDVIAIIAR